MDSITQIVLGAAVGEAVLGKKVGNKAILWGAVAGTIPDLDVVSNAFVDSLRAMELHRGFSHSLVFCLIAAPIFAWLVKRHPKIFLAVFLAIIYSIFFVAFSNPTARIVLTLIFALFGFFTFKMEPVASGSTQKDWTKMMFLSLVTHPLLDCHTSWGTQFFWPFDLKIAYNNIFVVDPLYTVPFLVCVGIAMFYKRTDSKRRFWNRLGLIVSSCYMLLTVVIKGIVYNQFSDSLSKQKIDWIDISTRPTPLNAIMWTANVETKDEYLIGYYSLLDENNNISYHHIPKNNQLLNGLENEKLVQRIIKLSQNEYALEIKGDSIRFNDLRFGKLEISNEKKAEFVFSYDIFYENGILKMKENEPPDEGMGDALKILWDRTFHGPSALAHYR